MSGQLQSHGDGDARCVFCGSAAVGPCARCRKPICGDCCVLTTGGLTTFAICLRCQRGGASLSAGFRQVVWWVMVPILALLGATIALEWLFGN
jgi:hypothetical protein